MLKNKFICILYVKAHDHSGTPIYSRIPKMKAKKKKNSRKIWKSHEYSINLRTF